MFFIELILQWAYVNVALRLIFTGSEKSRPKLAVLGEYR
jgi:hypothetical protein